MKMNPPNYRELNTKAFAEFFASDIRTSLNDMIFGSDENFGRPYNHPQYAQDFQDAKEIFDQKLQNLALFYRVRNEYTTLGRNLLKMDVMQQAGLLPDRLTQDQILRRFKAFSFPDMRDDSYSFQNILDANYKLFEQGKMDLLKMLQDLQSNLYKNEVTFDTLADIFAARDLIPDWVSKVDFAPAAIQLMDGRGLPPDMNIHDRLKMQKAVDNIIAQIANVQNFEERLEAIELENLLESMQSQKYHAILVDRLTKICESLHEDASDSFKPFVNTVCVSIADGVQTGSLSTAFIHLIWNGIENFSHNDTAKTVSHIGKAFTKLAFSEAGYHRLTKILQESSLKKITNHLPSSYAESFLKEKTNYLPAVEKQYVDTGSEVGQKLGTLSSTALLPRLGLFKSSFFTIVLAKIPLCVLAADAMQAAGSIIGSGAGYYLSSLDHLIRPTTSFLNKCVALPLTAILDISGYVTEKTLSMLPKEEFKLLNLSKDELKLLADTSEPPKPLIEAAQLANSIVENSLDNISNESGADTCTLGYEEIFFHTESGNPEIV